MPLRPAFLALSILAALDTIARAADGAPRLVLDFEDPADAALVQCRKPAQIVRDPVSHGAAALKLQSGDYINIRSSRLNAARPGDWLKIDLYNSASSPQPVRAELFDDTSRKGYWYRHVREYTLRPGWNTLRLPVTHLYRGEKNSQRIPDVFIDPAALNRVDLAFDEDPLPGFIVLDYVRFEPDTPMPPVDGLRAFDFGPPNQALRSGFTACSRETFDQKRGYGWSSAAWPGAFRDYIHPNNLLADFRESRGDTFSLALADGAWHVRVYYEDHGWWEDQIVRFDWRTISAAGKVVFEERLSPEQAVQRFYRFADTEPMPDSDLYDIYIRNGRYKPKEFDVDVKNGRLDLRFDADRPMVCRIAAIVLWPAGQQKAADAWCAELDRRLRDEYNSENVFIDTTPKAHRPDAVTVRPAGLSVFSAGPIEPVGPNYVPTPDQALSSLRIACAPGEDAGAALCLRSEDRGGALAVRAEINGLRSALFLIQNRVVRRGAGYTIAPDILRPLADAELRAGFTRQLWLEVEVPADAKPGRYDGSLSVSLADKKVSIPVAVEVLALRLSEPRFPFGLFGLMPDNPAPPRALEQVITLLRRHGLSSASGVPLGEARARDGKLDIDFALADRVMAALRSAGFKLPVDTYGGGLGGLAEAAADLKLAPDAALRQAMDRIREHADAAHWLPFSYAMVDEPHWSDDAVRSATKSVMAAHDAAPWLMTNGYWTPDAANPTHRALMDALYRTSFGLVSRPAVDYLKTAHKSMGFYGGTSRHEFGLKQWAAAAEGFDAHFAWHFYIRYGDLYYDLDAREPDVCMVYYSAAEIRPSLRLKELRAGAFDFVYLQTLADALAAHPGHPAAPDARRLLDTARDAGNIYARTPAPARLEPDALRKQVAEAILKLTAGR